MKEGWDNLGNNFCLPMEKYEYLERKEKVSLLYCLHQNLINSLQHAGSLTLSEYFTHYCPLLFCIMTWQISLRGHWLASTQGNTGQLCGLGYENHNECMDRRHPLASTQGSTGKLCGLGYDNHNVCMDRAQLEHGNYFVWLKI